MEELFGSRSCHVDKVHQVCRCFGLIYLMIKILNVFLSSLTYYICYYSSLFYIYGTCENVFVNFMNCTHFVEIDNMFRARCNFVPRGRNPFG